MDPSGPVLNSMIGRMFHLLSRMAWRIGGSRVALAEGRVLAALGPEPPVLHVDVGNAIVVLGDEGER